MKPGVYIFRDTKKNVLYVGKAKVLKNRVRSYFQKRSSLEPTKRIMVGKIADIEYIIVDSETEALLLESTLIKKHRPPFNVIFKDDKYYQYIRIALRDEYPRVDTVRRIVKDGSRYFGPFTSGFSVQQTLKLLKRIFPYKSCKEPPARPCFDAKIGRCLGHDLGPGSKERYLDVTKKLIRFLEGNADEVSRDLKTQMKDAATRKEYELAARLRDRIFAIDRVLAEQKVVSTKLENEDVIGMHRIADLAAVNLFQIRAGKLMNRQFHILQHVERESDVDILASFITQYYGELADHPTTVITRTMPTDVANLKRILGLRIEAPSRGRKRKLVALAEDNANDYLSRKQREWLSKEARAKLGLADITKALLFLEPPQRIECYDISNVQGTNAVGSMVVFEQGLPKKSDYRKFTIKTVEGSNDYAMLREIIRRRFGHHDKKNSSPARDGNSPPLQGGVAEGQGGTKQQEGWEDPDLIIIDGGKGQLSAVLGILRELDVLIPTIGLAKRLEEIFRPGQKEPLRLPKGSEGLYLLQRIRDEAHRFAIGSYRARHGKATVASLLDEVPGIGPMLKKKLITRFGSVEGVRSAEDSEIVKVIGVRNTAILREHL